LNFGLELGGVVMAQSERSTGAAPARVEHVPPEADTENLPALLGRLGDDVMTLVDAKLGLFKVELKEDAAVYARSGAMIAVGGLLAAVGFLLFNVAVAFFVSKLFSFSDERLNYALGFVSTGVLYLVLGAVLILTMKNRMSSYDPTPRRTIEEIRKDKQWLKNEI
jgi:uncharacterized membrane protein YqjE